MFFRPNKLYILPTRAGMGYCFVLLLLLLLSVNFENNLAYALTFLLTGVFIVAMHMTHSNLAGVKTEFAAAEACYAQDMALFNLWVSSQRGRDHYQLTASLPNQPSITFDIHARCRDKIAVPFHALERGWLTPGLLKIESRVPLGLFKVWTFHALNGKCLVYPQPVNYSISTGMEQGYQGRGRTSNQDGSDDFQGLTDYQAGMSQQHIAWKVFARGQGLHVKRYVAEQDAELWLDWQACIEPGVEAKLSSLCYHARYLTSQQRAFGLRLPGQTLAPAMGPEHLRAVLTTLALFGKESSNAKNTA
ncbi:MULTISPECIES: DUF58 domain-containing protein [Nitrincola]|uniref:Uncharacterized protein n=1 Tax=Nitrincola nitratireducens TaxID=1229521 RepID=W9US41_9GAMM|nr:MULTISPECIES: DUF58 domain-containing protein [Nitrincola]EXJ09889.1 hypothetical protein D791_03217 [Nitrincola nitratireducens]